MTKYFAQVDENNIVIKVIVAEQDFIDSGMAGDPSLWIECSIDGTFRNVYPGVGYHYDVDHDVFYSPSPYPSWHLDQNFEWAAPVPMPQPQNDGDFYKWNEENQEWDLISQV